MLPGDNYSLAVGVVSATASAVATGVAAGVAAGVVAVPSLEENCFLTFFDCPPPSPATGLEPSGSSLSLDSDFTVRWDNLLAAF